MLNHLQAYEDVSRESLDGRELEAFMLLSAASKLRACLPGRPVRGGLDSGANLNEALLFNQKLWTLLQVELSNPANPLPIDLRRDLIKLSCFVDKKLFALFSGGDLADLAILIRLNEEIAASLLEGSYNGLPDVTGDS